MRSAGLPRTSICPAARRARPLAATVPAGFAEAEDEDRRADGDLVAGLQRGDGLDALAIDAGAADAAEILDGAGLCHPR